MKGYQNSEMLKDMYLKDKLHSTQIAEVFGVSSSTIFRYLTKYEIPIRNKSERQIKFPKISFSNNLKEKAYMLGLRAGDINTQKKSGNSRIIRIQSTTTHPSFIRMINKVFGKYTSIRTHLRNNKTWKEWVVYADLDKSFDFLVPKPKTISNWILENEKNFFSFLAGYMDAEGNWTITKSNENDIRYMFRIRTCDKKILKQIKKKLEKLDFKCCFYLEKEKGTVGTCGKLHNDFFGIRIYRTKYIFKLVKILLPLSRHDEKIRRMKFILENRDKKWDKIKEALLKLRTEIKNEVIK